MTETNALARTAHPIHGPSHLVDLIADRYGEEEANNVTAALGRVVGTIPWLTILMAILPFILSIFSGKPIDIQALIAAILALLGKP